MSTPNQPKTVQKLLIRTLVLLFGIAGMIFGFQYFRGASKDFGGRSASTTTNMIAAVEYLKDGGSQAVLFRPDGTEIKSPEYKPGSTERDITWSPNGNFLFFVSDRDDGTFHVLRWSPSADKVEVRTMGRRGRSHPSFPVENVPDANEHALITSGGYVLEFDPTERATRIVLPPPSSEISASAEEEGGGAEGQFTGIYGKFGDSFRLARWFKKKTWIAGIMKRDAGDVLVAQSLTLDSRGRFPSPVVLAAANRIDIDVSPRTGALVYSVLGFQWPDAAAVPPAFRKGNKVTTPFRNVVALFDPETTKTGGDTSNGPVVVSQTDAAGFLTPRFSPDGQTVIFVVGSVDASGSPTPRGLVSVPARTGGAQAGSQIVAGEVFEPSWSPDGLTIAFARREPGGPRSIFTVAKDGSSERNVSGNQGDFGFPLFSPQTR